MVDETIVLDKFREVLSEKIQSHLRDLNAVFVPNRSFTSYVELDEIEDKFLVPLYGSRNLLRTEERDEERSYYWLLEKANLPAPEKIESPRDIDGLCIVKLPHKAKRLERGFFTAASHKEFKEKSEALLKDNVISREDLAEARIERYIIGPIFNFDFFYSPIEDEAEKLELIGIDWRFETSLDGHVRLPADQQLTLTGPEKIPEYVVVGHNTATLRESSLKDVFQMAEAYVKATQRHFAPGIIGPFTLQTAVDKDLKFWVYDVAPRIGGGTNVHMSTGHPYGNSLWRRPMSTGRRIAMEIRRGVDTGRLGEIVT
jgi:5-formaminoimidazole-4-carboxamide-1-(beta)-D-ribofuranosyl 5'-monophosphate synthetase